MAAQQAALAGCEVHVFDAMPSVGRKFLLAGKGGLNLTHSENLTHFSSRYSADAPEQHAQVQNTIAQWLQAFGPQSVVGWATDLGVSTFVGSSGRVFPVDMKAAPLLRAWLYRLRQLGVKFHMRHRWLGFIDADLQAMPAAIIHGLDLQFIATMVDPKQPQRHVHACDAVVLALGGGSWRRLGSDGAWVTHLQKIGIQTTPLSAANCGFDVSWSEHFRKKFAGEAVKTVALSLVNATNENSHIEVDTVYRVNFKQGEFIITETGVEGSLIYSASAQLRQQLNAAHTTKPHAIVYLDLLPQKTHNEVLNAVLHPKGTRSWSSHLKSRLGLSGVKAGLLQEHLRLYFPQFPTNPNNPNNQLTAKELANAIKNLPLKLTASRPIDEAISSAGGVELNQPQTGHALHQRVFFAGEMLNWDAPTGGYLLTACLASGFVAGRAAAVNHEPKRA